MRLLILPLVLLLGACWISDPFYSPADSSQPIAEGRYRASGAPEGVPTAQVSILPNGLTRIHGGFEGEDPTYLGFVPLDPERRRYLAWIAMNEAGAAEIGFYLLAVREGEGQFAFYFPRCEGDAAQTALASGAVFERDGTPSCRFPSRTSVESALRALVVSPDTLIGRLTKISDGG